MITARSASGTAPLPRASASTGVASASTSTENASNRTPKAGNTMATQPMIMSQYEQRVTIVRDIVKSHSKISEKAASEIAVRILQVLDTVPEKLR
jgi:hypothetical protein